MAVLSGYRGRHRADRKESMVTDLRIARAELAAEADYVTDRRNSRDVEVQRRPRPRMTLAARDVAMVDPTLLAAFAREHDITVGKEYDDPAEHQ